MQVTLVLFTCSQIRKVVGRGSVIPLFVNQRENGVLTITKPEMTRFLITLQKA